MDPEVTEVVPVADAAQKPQNTEPERKEGSAHPDEAKAEDQSPESEVNETAEQQTIKKLQRRIDRLTAQKGGTARERDMLREQLAGLQQSAGERTDEHPDIEALADQRAREMVSAQTLNEKAAALLKSGKRIAGFDSALETLRDEVPFTDAKGKVTPFLEAILESEMPAKLIEYLGKNPDEAAEFAELTPTQIGRRLDRLEQKLGTAGKAQTSKAPAPIEPVKGAGSKGLVDLASANMDDYLAQRRKQGAKWR